MQTTYIVYSTDLWRSSLQRRDLLHRVTYSHEVYNDTKQEIEKVHFARQLY